MKFIPRSPQTRSFIIEATAGLFNKQGYAGTSISDLTKATGLTKGSIYGNFENKEDVAMAAFDYTLNTRQVIIEKELQQAITCRDKLMVFATIFRSTGRQPFPEGGCPMLNTGTEADDTHAALRKKAADGLNKWVGFIETLIRQGIAEGEFKRQTDEKKTALAIVALVEGGILLAGTTGTPACLDLVLDSVQEIVESISVHK